MATVFSPNILIKVSSDLTDVQSTPSLWTTVYISHLFAFLSSLQMQLIFRITGIKLVCLLLITVCATQISVMLNVIWLILLAAATWPRYFISFVAQNLSCIPLIGFIRHSLAFKVELRVNID